MAKLRAITAKEASDHLKKVQELFGVLATQDEYGESGFSADKEAIHKVFGCTNDYEKADLLVRLTLIDSMYSTQMSRRYYALDELAEVLAKLADGKTGKLEAMFLAFAKEPEKNLSHFNYTEVVTNEKGENETISKNLFSECYGIGKDGEDKGVAISLISKYAYFLTGCKFPIYDSIACEMYPLVWHFCGWGTVHKNMLTITNKEGQTLGAETMIAFVNAINLLIDKLDCKEVDYDLLDRFLWFVGKILRGNLSLVLTREEYETTMSLYPPIVTYKENKKGEAKKITVYFDIEKVEIDKLTYLKKGSLLYRFFELAKFYGHKNR